MLKTNQIITRKITISTFISIDGVMQAPGGPDYPIKLQTPDGTQTRCVKIINNKSQADLSNPSGFTFV